MTTEEKQEHVFDLLRQLVNFARMEDKVRYREVRKELKRLILKDKEIREFVSVVLKGVKA